MQGQGGKVGDGANILGKGDGERDGRQAGEVAERARQRRHWWGLVKDGRHADGFVIGIAGAVRYRVSCHRHRDLVGVPASHYPRPYQPRDCLLEVSHHVTSHPLLFSRRGGGRGGPARLAPGLAQAGPQRLAEGVALTRGGGVVLSLVGRGGCGLVALWDCGLVGVVWGHCGFGYGDWSVVMVCGTVYANHVTN